MSIFTSMPGYTVRSNTPTQVRQLQHVISLYQLKLNSNNNNNLFDNDIFATMFAVRFILFFFQTLSCLFSLPGNYIVIDNM